MVEELEYVVNIVHINLVCVAIKPACAETVFDLMHSYTFTNITFWVEEFIKNYTT